MQVYEIKLKLPSNGRDWPRSQTRKGRPSALRWAHIIYKLDITSLNPTTSWLYCDEKLFFYYFSVTPVFKSITFVNCTVFAPININTSTHNSSSTTDKFGCTSHQVSYYFTSVYDLQRSSRKFMKFSLDWSF